MSFQKRCIGNWPFSPSRREFLGKSCSGAVATCVGGRVAWGQASTGDSVQESTAGLQTRGLVLGVSDLKALDWPLRAKQAGLTTIGTHISPGQVAGFIKSDQGQSFLQRCSMFGLEVEHELHAISDLLPRSLFSKDPAMFRMNEKGERVADWNFCVHSVNAIETICANAVEYAKTLKPTTGRYFYWIDDNRPMCHCTKCRVYSESDQALILENQLLGALRGVDPRATLAHLAYLKTLRPPTQVKPLPGVFLEFAPIVRSWNTPLSVLSHRPRPVRPSFPVHTHGETLELLDANLELFGRQDAQVLEYWLDVSLNSLWQRPAKKLPWREDVFLDDLQTYTRRGIRHITSFAVMIDDRYVQSYGEPTFVREYGRGLAASR